MVIHWVQNWNGTWHAWPQGGRSTMCGKVNAENLRARPARMIQSEAPTKGRVCTRCGRDVSGPIDQHNAPQVAAAWEGVLLRRFAHAHLRVATPIIGRVALLLGELGPPDSAVARTAYSEISPVFFTPRYVNALGPHGRRTLATLPHLKEAVHAVPLGESALARVVGALHAWRTITGRDPGPERFKRLDWLVQSILQVPAPPDSYIHYMKDKGLCALAVMFHPATIERARKDAALRGLFSGAADYYTATHGQLRVVTD